MKFNTGILQSGFNVCMLAWQQRLHDDSFAKLHGIFKIIIHLEFLPVLAFSLLKEQIFSSANITSLRITNNNPK